MAHKSYKTVAHAKCKALKDKANKTDEEKKVLKMLKERHNIKDSDLK